MSHIRGQNAKGTGRVNQKISGMLDIRRQNVKRRVSHPLSLPPYSRLLSYFSRLQFSPVPLHAALFSRVPIESHDRNTESISRMVKNFA